MGGKTFIIALSSTQKHTGRQLSSLRFWSREVKSLGGEAARGMGRERPKNVFLAASPLVVVVPLSKLLTPLSSKFLVYFAPIIAFANPRRFLRKQSQLKLQ